LWECKVSSILIKIKTIAVEESLEKFQQTTD